MAKTILMEEFHLSVLVPHGLREAEYQAIRQILVRARFRARLGRAARDVCRQYPALRKVRVRLAW